MTVRLRLVTLASIAVAGCVPHYRVDAQRAVRANGAEASEAARRAHQSVGAADADASVSRFEEAIALNPAAGPDLYLGLARAQAGANRRGEARATARWVLERFEDAASSREARQLLAEGYAEEGLCAAALANLPEASLERAVRIPALARELGPLAEALRSSGEGRHREALERYAAWLADYGFPDHPILRDAVDRILGAAAGRTAASLQAQGDRWRSQGEWRLALFAYAAAWRYQPLAAASQTLQTRLVPVFAELESDDPLSPTAARWARAGDEAFGAGRLGEALKLYRRAVANAPWWPHARRNLALLLGAAGQPQAAVAQMKVYSALAPGDAQGPALAQGLQRSAGLQGDSSALRAAGLREAKEAVEDRGRRSFGLAFVGLGGVLGGGALTFALLGERQNARIREGGFGTARDIDAAFQRGASYNTAATALAISAGAVALIGVPFVLFNLPSSPQMPQLVPLAGPSAVGAGLSWRLR